MDRETRPTLANACVGKMTTIFVGTGHDHAGFGYDPKYDRLCGRIVSGPSNQVFFINTFKVVPYHLGSNPFRISVMDILTLHSLTV